MVEKLKILKNGVFTFGQSCIIIVSQASVNIIHNTLFAKERLTFECLAPQGFLCGLRMFCVSRKEKNEKKLDFSKIRS